MGSSRRFVYVHDSDLINQNPTYPSVVKRTFQISCEPSIASGNIDNFFHVFREFNFYPVYRMLSPDQIYPLSAVCLVKVLFS